MYLSQKRVTGCILSNVNTPSITPVIGQPQNESSQNIYQNNNNVSSKPTAAKILGKVGESLSRICCVRPPMERFTFVDENANLGTVMRYEEIGKYTAPLHIAPTPLGECCMLGSICMAALAHTGSSHLGASYWGSGMQQKQL
ncbi:hypothetical protein DV515_00005029 [Chloebia gouldiae]|uniref:Uncharacterized protein n=1 Tax=Chloebia gouldiae TaxID=44316 RepID=A0A3L8SQG9_CHLGU|nr:hypothetical protein DV515_00005029 [Chloebia gouldiae]